jgi:ABC-type sugar transport system ATPase subunit
MASVSLENIDKWYGRVVHAVRDVSLKIEDGEFFGLLGPSGSGKTSVLRMMAGLENVSRGTIRFGSEPVQDRTPQQRNVAMVFEQNALYPHMTARQNIAYPLKIRGTAKSEIAAKVDEVATLLNIAHLLDRRASQMSGGQQQRIAIARALVRRPNLLCLDEPIAHLDTLLRARLLGELKRLQRSLNTTSVIVTHDPIEAMTMTDRLAVMRDGILQQIGTPHDIHEKPVNAFVARFFGLHSMNVFTLRDITENGSFSGMIGDTRCALPAVVKAHAGKGSTALGCRPSLIHVSKAGEAKPDASALRIPGRVYVAEQLGDAQLVTVQIGGQTLQAFAPHDRSFDIDEPVEIVVPEAALYVFEGEDERTVRFAERAASAETAALRALAS